MLKAILTTVAIGVVLSTAHASSSSSSSECNVVEATRHLWHAMQRDMHTDISAAFHHAAVSYVNGELNPLTSGLPLSLEQNACVSKRVDKRMTLKHIGRDWEHKFVGLEYDLYIDEHPAIPVYHSLEFDRATCQVSVERVFHATDSAGYKELLRQIGDDCFGQTALDQSPFDDLEVVEKCWSYFVNEDAAGMATCFSNDFVWYINGDIQPAEAKTEAFWANYFSAVNVLDAEFVKVAKRFSENRVSVEVRWRYMLNSASDKQVFEAYTAQLFVIEDGKAKSIAEAESNTQPIQRALGMWSLNVPDMLNFKSVAAAYSYADAVKQFGKATLVSGQVDPDNGIALFADLANPWKKVLADAFIRDEAVMLNPRSAAEAPAHSTFLYVVMENVKLTPAQADAFHAVSDAVVYDVVAMRAQAREATVGAAAFTLRSALKGAFEGDVSARISGLPTGIDALYQKTASGEISRTSSGAINYVQSKLDSLITELTTFKTMATPVVV